MSLVTLSAVNRTPQEWSVWSYSNQDHHIVVSNTIYSMQSILLPSYPLDPILSEDGSSSAPGMDWLYNHQQWHNAINAALGTTGVDLTSVDFSRQDQAEVWAWLHFSEHLRWNARLGL